MEWDGGNITIEVCYKRYCPLPGCVLWDGLGMEQDRSEGRLDLDHFWCIYILTLFHEAN